jgi:ATP-binding cassette subfamily C protein LapB
MSERQATWHESSVGARSNLKHCLMPLLDALEWRGDQGQLAEARAGESHEMGLFDILNTMANLGFEGHQFDTCIDQITEHLTPCIFVARDGAARVIVKSDGEYILAYDSPELGYRRVFKEQAEGTAIFFKRLERADLSLLQSQPDWFAKVMARFRKLFFNVLLLSLILSLLALISPLFIMSIYGQMTAVNDTSTYVFWIFGVTIYAIANGGFRILRTYMMGFISVRLGNIVGNQVMRRLLYLSPASTENAALAPQVARIRDFETVRDFFAGPAATALLDLPFILLLIVGLVIIGGTIAYVPAVAVLLFVMFGFAITRVTKRVNVQVAQTGSQKQEFLLEMLTNLMTIRYMGVRGPWLERYRSLSAAASIRSNEAARLNAIINTITAFIVSGSLVATVGVGALSVMAGRMDVGALMASIFLVSRILGPLKTGFVVISQIDKIRKSIAQLNRFMKMPLEKKAKASAIPTLHLGGGISFSNISLRYSSDAFPALIGVNMQVEQGEMLAIVGHEGAGKSTMLKLVLGMYIPQIGRVLVGDMNVRQIDPIRLRRSISYASESAQLFNGTLADNLRLTNPIATEEDLRLSVRKTGILSAIEALPDGFETIVNVALSEQFSRNFTKRLVLARTFLRKSTLLLLDSPEDSLSSTAWLVEELSQLKQSCTIIMVTQSRELFDLSDKMAWVDHGRLHMFGPSENVANKYNDHISH